MRKAIETMRNDGRLFQHHAPTRDSSFDRHRAFVVRAAAGCAFDILDRARGGKSGSLTRPG